MDAYELAGRPRPPDSDDHEHIGRLVLGDFGLVFQSETAGRVTETFEHVGTRDFMPGWAMGLRVEQIMPNFDVFALGKFSGR